MTREELISRLRDRVENAAMSPGIRAEITASLECMDGLTAQRDFLLSELLDREDVVDGSEGRQDPNEAMSILAEYEGKWPLDRSTGKSVRADHMDATHRATPRTGRDGWRDGE